MAKRVCCLYRVSTKGQVEKDDIPMQKQRCREFAEANGWEIVMERSEKGVSGFKVSAKDRDAIQDIQKAALQGQFDILLVFMFDRLGRREDETPFVVEWFVNNGIEVWSTVEGQQRFDTHVDKLMNYIRYWQASGESIKTSIRTKTRLAQIVQEGRFRGGPTPYGYRLVKKGRRGKKNRELYDIEVNPDEAEEVREMFALADKFGYGGRKISSELRTKGMINRRTGKPFHYSTVANILRNIQYTGVLRSGESHSDVIPELQIVSQEQFERVGRGLEQRCVNYAKKFEAAPQEETGLSNADETALVRLPRMVPVRNCGQSLLSGNIYCGHCGARMFSSTAKRTGHVGKEERIRVYRCYSRANHMQECDGQSTYQAAKVDAVVEQLILRMLDAAKSVNEEDLVKREVQTTKSQYQRRLKQAKSELGKASAEYAKWQALMLDSVAGACVFTPEQVKGGMDEAHARMTNLRAEISELERKAAEVEARSAEIRAHHRKLVNWADIYKDASLEEKRAVAAFLIKSVTLTRGYGMQVEFNISEAQYLGGLDIA